MIATEPLSVLQRLARLEEGLDRLETRDSELATALLWLETRDAELARALLAYVQADIASPWLAPANRLEAVLTERLK